MAAPNRSFEHRGFLCTDGNGHDLPWRAWREDGTTYRADTKAGIRQIINDNHQE